MSRVEADSGTPVARWADADYSVVLYRGSCRSAFRLIVTSPRLEAPHANGGRPSHPLWTNAKRPSAKLCARRRKRKTPVWRKKRHELSNKAAFRP